MKTINNPTLEQLISIPHGTKVRVNIEGTECDAIVNTEEKWKGERAIFLCQNEKGGAECSNKMSMKYSWVVVDGDDASFIHSITIPDTEPEYDDFIILLDELVEREINEMMNWNRQLKKAGCLEIIGYKWNPQTGWE